MASKTFRIVVPANEYTNKEGEKKTRWNEVGRLVCFFEDGIPDGFILELGMFPSTKFKVFPIEALKSPKVGGGD